MNLPVTNGPKPSLPECDKILTAPGRVFELEDVVIDGRTVRAWKHAPRSFRDYLLQQFKLWADREFLSGPVAEPADFDAREVFTYKQSMDKALQWAAWLRGLGVRQGDRVAIGGSNTAQWVFAFVAVCVIGAVPVMLNAELQDTPQIHCLTLSDPTVVLVDEKLAPVIAPLVPALKEKGIDRIYCWSSIRHLPPAVQAVIGEIPSAPADPKLLNEVLTGVGCENLTPESDGTIFFTSGTTSLPKAVLSSQRQSLHNVISGSYIAARAGMRAGLTFDQLLEMQAQPQPQTVMLLPVPLFHATGCLAMMLRMIAIGGKIVFLRRWSVPYAVKTIVAEKVTFLGGVPAIATAIVQSPLLPKDHQFSQVSYGGAPPAERLADDLHKRFPGAILAHGWGMTESNAPITHMAGQDYVDRPKSCGFCLPICELKVVDPDTREVVPQGTPGLLLTRGSNVMTCYFNNPKATAETIDADGWLNTGDIGYQDEDGYLYLSDRAKDIIIRGGENIPSAEVENAITADERVAEAASVAVPDVVLGELVAAAVTLRPGSHATAEEIRQSAASRLRYPARPVLIVIYDEMPRNANGKIVKADIKKRLGPMWAEQAASAKSKAKL